MMSIRRPLFAVVVVAALLASCSFPKSAVPPPDASTPAPAGVPTNEQPNVSPYPIEQRLGLWNGTTFQQMSTSTSWNDQLIGGGHVIVLTHGWAVGWLDTYESLQSKADTLVPFWDTGFTDPSTGVLLAQNFLDLAAALKVADPTATILMYSWIDQSSTPLSALAAYAPERATEVNGHRMATAIDELLSPSFASSGGQVHLIGHSFGANVATTAALAMARPPRQLTLFDSPEVDLARFGGAKNDLRYKLPRLQIGRIPGTTFVDNYISEVGEEFHGYPGLEDVVDMRLAPPKSDNGGAKHEFPIGWYADTVKAFGTSAQQVGYAWSPLIGANDVPIGSYWTQAPADGAVVATTYTQVEGPPTPGVTSTFGLLTTPLTIASGPVTVAPGSVTNISFTTDSDSLWLTYDLDPGTFGDTVQFYIDGRERSEFAVPNGATGTDGSFVILYDVPSGDHTLSIASTFRGQYDTAVSVEFPTISNLAIVSTTGIDRNLTPGQIRSLVRWVAVVVVVVLLVVFALLVWAIVAIVRRMRRRRSRVRGGTAN